MQKYFLQNQSRGPYHLKAPSLRILAVSLLMALLALGLTAESGVAAPWTFAVLGDQRGDHNNSINKEIVEKMAAQIASQSPAFVLGGGDQIHGIVPGEIVSENPFLG